VKGVDAVGRGNETFAMPRRAACARHLCAFLHLPLPPPHHFSPSAAAPCAFKQTLTVGHSLFCKRAGALASQALGFNAGFAVCVDFFNASVPLLVPYWDVWSLYLVAALLSSVAPRSRLFFRTVSPAQPPLYLPITAGRTAWRAAYCVWAFAAA